MGIVPRAGYTVTNGQAQALASLSSSQEEKTKKNSQINSNCDKYCEDNSRVLWKDE